jgi:hypothetical protein
VRGARIGAFPLSPGLKPVEPKRPADRAFLVGYTCNIAQFGLS